MHDLVKLYAAEQPSSGEVALGRLVDHYLHTAYTAERVLYPARTDLKLPDAAAGTVVEAIQDATAAMAWFDAEEANLLALRQIVAERAWSLAWCMATYQVRRNKYADRLELWLAALPHAGKWNVWELTLAHRSVADAYAHLGRHDEAMHHLRLALAAAEASGNPVMHGNVHYGMSAAYEERGDYESAVEHSTRALRLYQTGTNQTMIAQGHAAVAWHSALAERYDNAREHGERARELFIELNAVNSLACALDTLALVANKTGDHARAVELCREALELFRQDGDLAHVADVTLHLGEALVATGDERAGRAALVQARELYVDQGRTAEAERVAELL
jgi:tetratricopeptide (TPR) repeat protein